MSRETQAWADWELDALEKWHALKGTAHVQQLLAAKGVKRSDDSIRQKASRLGLSHGMREFTFAAEVRAEAGYPPKSDNVVQWVRKQGYLKHCRSWGRQLLLPAPVVALYLHSLRVSERPRGYWGTAKAAEYLGLDVTSVERAVRSGKLDGVQYGRTFFVDPTSAHEMKRLRQFAPSEAVKVRTLAGWLERDPAQLTRQLRRQGIAPICHHQQGKDSALFIVEADARAFLSQEGHRSEVIETLVRKAQAIDAARRGLRPEKT